jgi:hypothetical protein
MMHVNTSYPGTSFPSQALDFRGRFCGPSKVELLPLRERLRKGWWGSQEGVLPVLQSVLVFLELWTSRMLDYCPNVYEAIQAFVSFILGHCPEHPPSWEHAERLDLCAYPCTYSCHLTDLHRVGGDRETGAGFSRASTFLRRASRSLRMRDCHSPVGCYEGLFVK